MSADDVIGYVPADDEAYTLAAVRGRTLRFLATVKWEEADKLPFWRPILRARLRTEAALLDRLYQMHVGGLVADLAQLHAERDAEEGMGTKGEPGR